MTPDRIAAAARLLWRAWQEGARLPEGLPDECRPRSRADGYAVQAAIARLAGDPLRGWKIAATSTAGQRHIGVDGPLGGRLLARYVLDDGATIPFGHNLMAVAEAEFAFRLGHDLPPRGRDYEVAEVMAAVDALYPTIEAPDSRYRDFAAVGAAQLIADHACAGHFVLGPPCPAPWRAGDLRAHRVTATRNGERVAEGTGANVLGDPCLALTWLANEVARHDDHGLRAGEMVSTGTCVVPWAIRPGDRLRADFGVLGSVSCAIGP